MKSLVTPFVAATALIAGCSSSPKVTLAPVGTSPAGSFSAGAATVPVGIVLGFEARAEGTTPVTASIDDPALATVVHTTQGSQFVLIGLATGHTTLHVYVNNQQWLELPVEVTGTAF